MRRRALLAAAMFPALKPAVAQGVWPTRPIRFVVPWAPGGSTGVIGRIVSEAMSPTVGQPLVLDHRPGAGGSVGSDNVAKSPPDGYTILLAGAATFYRPLIDKDTPFDPARDFGFVGLIGVGPFGLVTRTGLPVTLPEFLAHARNNPGRLSFASSGQYSTSHLAAEMLNRGAGIDAVHVPYPGTGPAVIDLVAGRIDYFFSDLSTILEHVRSGRVTLIGVTTTSRVPQVPNVPTISEAGLPGYSATPWWGVCCPAGVPEPVVDRLSAALRESLAQRSVVDGLDRQGCTATPMTSVQFASFVRSENEKWSALIRAIGPTPG